MAIKVYVKKGALNYKERSLVKQLQEALAVKKINPEEFQPATSFDQLKMLHNTYCVEDAQIVSETKNSTAADANSSNDADSVNAKVEEEETQDDAPDRNIADPFNEADVNVRDYVIDDKDRQLGASSRSDFGEPTDDNDAFDMSDATSGDNANTQQGGGQPGQSTSFSSSGKSNTQNPIPPKKGTSFSSGDDTSKSSNKSLKRLAQSIITGVCLLSEFGCKWWVTKDITEDKIAEYELDNSIDLNILLTLPNDQRVTVRRWFAEQVQLANETFVVNEEAKKEMANSLYEVLLEKGVKMTPTQELMISFGINVVLDLGTKAYAMGAAISGVLSQLKQMQKENNEAQPASASTVSSASSSADDLSGNANENIFTDKEADNEIVNNTPESTAVATTS